MRIKHLFLFGLIFLMAACQKEPIYQQPEINFTESYESHEEITGEQAKDVVNFLDQTISSKNLKLGKLNLPFDKNLIDKKTIVKVEDSATGLINYTFGVKREESDNFLFQVVVTEFENQQYSEPYIFKFTFDGAFRKKLNKGAADWSEYKWPIYPYSLSAAEEALSKSEPCPTIYPSPSSGGTGSTGTGSTGTGSTGTGSTGSGDNEVSAECAYVTYEQEVTMAGTIIVSVKIKIVCHEKEPPQVFTGSFTDCPTAPTAPIGINDPDRTENPDDWGSNAKIEYFQTELLQAGKSTWSAQRLKNDPWFVELVGWLTPRPAMYEQFKDTADDPWPAIATSILVAQATTGNLSGALQDIIDSNIQQKFEQLSSTIVNAYNSTVADLPTTSEGWTDLGLAVSGTLAWELAQIANPILGAAGSLQAAWQAMDDGQKLLAAGLVVAAVAEFIPWTKVASATIKIADVAITTIKSLKSWQKLFNGGGDALKGILKNLEFLSLSDNAYKLGLDAADAAEDAIQASGKSKPSWNEIKALFKRGNDFNKKARDSKWYDFHEIHLSNGKRLDSYDPDLGQIVSRKATDLNKISESTFMKYLSEFKNKYDVGTVIRSNKYPELDGKKLTGDFILEIPFSNKNSSRLADFQKLAESSNVTIVFKAE